MTEIKTTKIPHRQRCINKEHPYTSGAMDIYDDEKEKSQEQVNKDVDDTFAFHQSEINALNSQNYVTVDSFSSLPATGAVDTVYRVSNWDGTQQDPSVYSEYAWNGEDYVHLSTKTQIGEVFDISAYHATGGELAKYADLAAALGTNGANIPDTLRKGGMSVKFVLSSDNKYVQYRYMGTATTGNPNPFLDTANWQGVDDEPTVGSDNLVKSGGTALQIAKKTSVLKLSDFTRTRYRLIETTGALTANGAHDVYSIANAGYTFIFVKASSVNPNSLCIAFYSGSTMDAAGFISGVQLIHTSGGTYTEEVHYYGAAIPSNCKTIAFSTYNAGQSPEVYVSGSEVLTEDIKNLKSSLNETNYQLNSRIYNCHQGQSEFAAFQTNQAAKDAVPSQYRRLGQLLAYLSEENCGWVIQQYIGPNYYPNRRDYFKTIVTAEDSHKYLGDFTSLISGTGDSAVCSYNPSNYDNVVGVIGEKFKYSRYFFSVSIPAKTKVTFTNLITEGQQTPFSINNTSDYTRHYLVYKTLTYYTAKVLPISDNLNSVEKDVALIKNRTTDIRLNPLKNLFTKDSIVNDKKVLITYNPLAWSIVDAEHAKIAIVQLPDYNTGSYLVVAGLQQTRDTRQVIFLNESMQPEYAAGAHALSTGINVYELGNSFYYKWKYAVISLYNTNDYQNTDSSHGYVWTAEEIAQGYPNWIFDVVVNSVIAPVTPSTVCKEAEYVCGDTYDVSKHSLFAEVGNKFASNILNPSNFFNFLFATDSHIDFSEASQRNVKDMIEFGNQSNIRSLLDCIIQNGDICTPAYIYSRQQSVYGYDTYYNIIKNSGVPVIQVSGNHDRHQEAKVLYADALTYSECVDYLKDYSLHTSDYLYDYQDFVSKKVRIIKLDGFEYPLESTTAEGLDNVVKYPLTKYDCLVSQTQMQWLVNTLLSTPDDYTVIVTGHIYRQNVITQYITEILSAAAQKLSGSTLFDYSMLTPPTGYSGFPYGSFTISYDFTAGNNIKVAAMMCGHDHRDSYEVINGINVINTACQALEKTTGNQKARNNYSLFQNCFNTISLDLVNNKLILNRYGWGYPSGVAFNGQTEFNY